MTSWKEIQALSPRAGAKAYDEATEHQRSVWREERAVAATVDSGDPGPFSLLVEQEWQSLLDKDDRTSPAEYPEMCMLTRIELANAMTEAFILAKTDRPACGLCALGYAPFKAEGLMWHQVNGRDPFRCEP